MRVCVRVTGSMRYSKVNFSSVAGWHTHWCNNKGDLRKHKSPTRLLRGFALSLRVRVRTRTSKKAERSNRPSPQKHAKVCRQALVGTVESLNTIYDWGLCLSLQLFIRQSEMTNLISEWRHQMKRCAGAKTLFLPSKNYHKYPSRISEGRCPSQQKV